MSYLITLWQTHGWWVLMVPGAGALLLLFLLAEAIQVAFVRRRWWIVAAGSLVLIIVDAGVGYILFLAGVQPRWAAWIPLVVTGGMFLAALVAEVRLVRRWITERWPRNGIVTSHMLNVRDAPPDGEVVRRLKRGDKIQVIDQTDDARWCQIGEDEWVAARYVQLS